MHLAVTCPRCQSKYQLDPGMRGKRMRCPNTICRAIFEVRDDNDPPTEITPPPVREKPPEPPNPAPVVAQVKEKTPTTPGMPKREGEAPAEPPSRNERTAPAARQEPRPPVASPAEPPPKVKPPEPKKPAPVEPKAKEKPVEVRKPAPPPSADFPDDFPGDDDASAAPAPAIATEAWQPEALEVPPARDAIVAGPPPTHDAFASGPPPVAYAPGSPTPAPRRRAVWMIAGIIAGMLIVLGAVAGVGYWRITGSIESNEAKRFQDADNFYKEENFDEASAALQKLHRDFPDSPQQKKYRFLAELSDVRKAVYARESTDETAKALQRLLQFSEVYKGDPLLKEHDTDLRLTFGFLANELTKLAESEKTPALLDLAKSAWKEAARFPDSGNAERERELKAKWTRVEQALDAHFERLRVIAVIKKNTERATAASVEEAWTSAEKTKLQDDAEIRALLGEFFKAQREQVAFKFTDNKAAPRNSDDDALESISVTPSLKADAAAKVTGLPVLALARGVLYAFEPAKGELRWARRVGIDTNLLPLRVPADALTPELVLVMSSDQRSLSALIAATGETLWQTPLSEACLGTPVLVDRVVLAPTVAGQIDEIEIAEGRLVGSYRVGQPLTRGGVHQPGTSLVYFPADEFCLYVIDITKRACTNIVYTRHPAGSLRGLPEIVSDGKADWLLWTQAKGERVEIKPLALPFAGHEPKAGEPILQFPALSAPPWLDAHRLAVMTETGMLSLWGVRQKGTSDPLLFPLLTNDFPVDLGQRAGRCQVVYADVENIWTLARGRLQRVETTFQPTKGPDLLARWTQPIPLGHALHAAQIRHEPDGRLILYLTTQAEDHATCLLSAVSAADGKILWQRQLGVLPQGTPHLVGAQIVLPCAEGILRFQANAAKTDKRWRQAGDWVAQESWPTALRVLLTNETGFVQLSWRPDDTNLHVAIGTVPSTEKIRTLEVKLPAALQGTPALGDGFLLCPLANGILVRLSLTDGAYVNVRDWRAPGAEENARGHVVMLSTTEFILTDGSRGIARIVSGDGKTWDKRAANQLAHRIVRPPVVVPAGADGKPRLCTLDASDTLTLLDADRLTVLKSWAGKVTAGPFVRAGKIGCVVARKQLIWLEPNQPKFAWEYGFDADVVGEPNIIDGMLIVGDVAGQFIALDPASGTALGPRLTLKANVGPTAAPLPFGPGRAFVPLTDGTIVIVPLEKLR